MNIFTDGILVDVSVSFWSGAKALNPEDLGFKNEDVNNGAYKLGNKMLVPREVIKKFRALDGKARHLVDINSFKFPIGNARFIPKKKFPTVLKKLKKIQNDYNRLTEELVANYNKYREEMIPIYKGAAEKAYFLNQPTEKEFSIETEEEDKTHFINNFLMRISAYYPLAESLRSKFSLNWDVYEIALPQIEKGDADNIADKEDKRSFIEEEYKTQAREKIKNFVNEVVTVLRSETVSLCDRIVDNIQKGKVVRSQTLKSIRDFIENFEEMNFVGDTTIEEELNKLKSDFLDNYSNKQISNEVELQAELKRRLKIVSKKATDITDINSITGQYHRKLSFK